MCFFGGGGSGPQSKADIAAGGYKPPGYKPAVNKAQAAYGANPHNDAATPQGQRAAVTNQNTADRNTIRRADSYGSKQAASKSKSTSNAQAVQGGRNIMSALTSYNKNKKTILGS